MHVFRLLMVALMVLIAQIATAQQTPEGSIEGIVVRMGTSEPIAGAEVELTRVESPTVTSDRAASPPTVFRASTSDDGKFVLKNIPNGRYRLVATRAGGMFAPAEYGQRDPKGRGTTFQLASGQSLSDVRLSMAPTGSITGRVSDDDDPVANARLMALEAVYQNGRRTLKTVQAVRTNDLGEYRLFWLRPGRYYVGVMREDLRTFSFSVHVTPPDQFGSREDATSPTVRERPLEDGRVIEETSLLVYFGGGIDEGKAQGIDLLPGATVSGIDVSVRTGVVSARRVKGVVVGSNGQPAGGARVRLVPLQSAPHVIIPNATADNQGAFNIAGAVPGRYFLVATLGASSGWNFNESLFDIGSGTGGSLPIEIADRDLDNVSIVLKSPFGLAGRLYVEGNGAGTKWDVTQARISLTRDPNLLGMPNPSMLNTPRPGQRQNGVPSEDGSFVLGGLGQSEYRVNIGAIPSSAYVEAIQMGGTDVLRNGMRIEDAPGGQLDILVNLEGGTLEGTAMNEKSEPISNATVVLIPDVPFRNSPYLYKVAASDVSGKFEIKGIAPGMYKAFGWESAPSEVWHDPEFIQEFEVRGKPIRFTDGSTQQLGITVSGQVRERL